MADYCTLAELKRYLSISDANSDAALAEDITGASRWIESECGRRFDVTGTAEAPVARYYTASSGDRVLVDDLLSVVTLKTDDDGDGVYETTWTASDYVLGPRNAAANAEPYWKIVVAPNGNYTFPLGEDGVQVSGVWGYWTSVPDLIKQACVREAARRFRLRDAPFGVTGTAEMGTTTVGAYDPQIRKDLAMYRRGAVG